MQEKTEETETLFNQKRAVYIIKKGHTAVLMNPNVEKHQTEEPVSIN